MKIKHKGKVYPSPSSSSTTPVNGDGDGDVLSVLKLLPAAILALAFVLSLEDREVLAYMITRSLKTTTTNNPSSFVQDSKKKSSRKPSNTNPNNHSHKTPIFDCDCFDCYTSYWIRWDSSPNQELIHQVIEAFEDHLTNGELSRRNSRGKRRDKTGRRVSEKSVHDVPGQPEMLLPVLETETTHDDSSSCSVVDGVEVNVGCQIGDVSTEKAAAERKEMEEAVRLYEDVPEVVAASETAVVMGSAAHGATLCSHHKGLARKVLPDVLGLLNSRLWSLWSPKV